VNLKQALAYARKLLAENAVDDAALEAEVLLRHLLGMDRTQFFLKLDNELDSGKNKIFKELLTRRIKGEPSAYITGHREFFGLDFKVNGNVLIPRPETELLVEQAIKLASNYQISSIVDAGTGCGALAITLAIYLPHVIVYATDISTTALEVAVANCKKHGVLDRITFLYGDMLSPVTQAVDLIVANLPYVKESDLPDNKSLSYEPVTALKGGIDGLDKLKQLFRQSGTKLRPEGHVLAEIGQGQAIPITDFIKTEFSEAQFEIHKDLAGIDRVIQFRLTKDLS
jgi:release factor glutamine methyltransferase